MKVLVMGGTNFNGLALVHELVRQGHDVTVLNRGRSESNIPDSVDRLIGDRSEPDSAHQNQFTSSSGVLGSSGRVSQPIVS